MKKSKLNDENKNFKWVNDNGEELELLEQNFAEIKPITLSEDGTRYILTYMPVKISKNGKHKNSYVAFFAIKHTDGEKELIPLSQIKIKYFTTVFPEWKESRWNIKNAKDWLSSPDTLDLLKFYQLLDETTRSYFEYRDDYDYHFFNLWNIGTYCYSIFNSYPYIDYTGTKRAGKSKNQTFNTIICYNGISTSDITSSALFRLIDGIGATISIDEYENSSKSAKERNEQTRTLLNSGFMSHQFAIRNREHQGDYIPTQYDLYSPKNMAHIDGFDDVLEDRCVEQIILRSTNENILNSWPDPENDPRLFKIRDQCYRFFLDYGEEIKKLIKTADNLLKITSREKKIWIPIMTLALLFESHGVIGLTDRIQQKIQRSHEEREIADQQQNLDLLILKFVKDYFYTRSEEQTNWFSTQKIYGNFHDVAKDYSINIRTISRIQFSKILKRLGFTPKRSSKSVNWLLEKEEITKAMIRMGLEKPTLSTKSTQGTSSQTNNDVDNAENVRNEAKPRGEDI